MSRDGAAGFQVCLFHGAKIVYSVFSTLLKKLNRFSDQQQHPCFFYLSFSEEPFGGQVTGKVFI